MSPVVSKTNTLEDLEAKIYRLLLLYSSSTTAQHYREKLQATRNDPQYLKTINKALSKIEWYQLRNSGMPIFHYIVHSVFKTCHNRTVESIKR